MTLPNSLHELLQAISTTKGNSQVDVSKIPQNELLSAMEALNSLVVYNPKDGVIINPSFRGMLNPIENKTLLGLISGYKPVNVFLGVTKSPNKNVTPDLYMMSVYPDRTAGTIYGVGGGGSSGSSGSSGEQLWSYAACWWGVNVWLSHKLLNEMIGGIGAVDALLVACGMSAWIAAVISAAMAVLKLADIHGRGVHICITWLLWFWIYPS